MIERVKTYRRPDGRYSDYTTNYRAIWFADDQSYYRAVTWMREEHGRAGSFRAKTPKWVHNPHTLTISLRWTSDAMKFLMANYDWKHMLVYVQGPANATEIHEWCEDRGYLCEVKFGSFTICAPTEQDLLMARLRFSDHAVPVPVF